MSGDGKRSVAAWPKPPRPSSTLRFIAFRASGPGRSSIAPTQERVAAQAAHARTRRRLTTPARKGEITPAEPADPPPRPTAIGAGGRHGSGRVADFASDCPARPYRKPHLLEVAPPPPRPSLLHGHEPAAKRVESQDDEDRHGVYSRQAQAVTRRLATRSAQEPGRLTPDRPGIGHGERVNEVDVSHVVEQRNPPKGDDPVSKAALRMLKGREHQQARSQGHHQIEQ